MHVVAACLCVSLLLLAGCSDRTRLAALQRLQLVADEQRAADRAGTAALGTSDKPDLVLRGWLDERALRIERFTALLTMVPEPKPDEVPLFPAVPPLMDSTSGYKDGFEVFKDKGCARCHTIDGTRLVGGSMRGLLGSTIMHTDESTAVVDEAYVFEAVLRPGLRVTKGYVPVMPSYESRIKTADLVLLLAWLRTLDTPKPAANH